MVVVIGSMALVFYLGHRRQELAREQTLDRRIQSLATPPQVQTQTRERVRIAQPGPPVVIKWDPLRNLGLWLAQGGIKMTPINFVAMVLLIGMGVTALSGLIFAPKVAVLCGVAPAMVPVVYLFTQRKQRLAVFSQQLPYILDFMRSALSAGHTLLRGVQMAAENAPEPIATELRSVVEQIRLGSSLADALENMFRRVPEESLGFLVAAVRVQAEVGSGISEILDRVTDTIRDRQRLQQEIRTLTSQSRMSGMIVAALPFALLGIFALIRPAYIEPLFTNPLGKKILETAVVLDLIALAIIRHMVRVD
jgi:tight adherence protein B